ncbi:crosslink repair DNA glycosylase YcaQ family protein [Crossiella sp. CA-258035]|uniref:DNA glycosylase AlkZ-like family protein n=1 Tax=Crossiella sp. CA-258035 TaxID=2981138 RepID=UPI0024BD1D9A|nr:crosslink repair DNA glycosylase YcaQ family protein [Crossiella sp. CA-258035]WHT15827.1 crosslink repair DNA glycosylase YcaQ family protein [Crossiella sp. CA-258035]
MAASVTRAQALAYRMAAQGLHREHKHARDLDVLALGVQDTRGSAQLALAARLPEPPEPTEDLALLWSVRGAPHLHRRRDLTTLARHLWPRDEKDAFARLGSERKPLKAAGISSLDAFRAASTALRDAVPAPMPRGEVSAAVTRLLPPAYSYDCRTCQSHHIYGSLFQTIGLFAGLRHDLTGPALLLRPLEDRPPIPDTSAGATPLILDYLRLHGPATRAEAAAYLGTSQSALAPVWPTDLAEVTLDGAQTWLPADALPQLRTPPKTQVVRLLPPLDPYLQARDRERLVPDAARRKEIWKIIGNPGALLVNGELAGTWRPKSTAKRLELTVTAFEPLTKSQQQALQREAELVATVRGLPEVRLIHA